MAKTSRSAKRKPQKAQTPGPPKRAPASGGGRGRVAPDAGAARSPVPVAGASVPAVKVRMYRQGLGDCFLLTFNAGAPTEQHMLIDCGTLGNKTTKVTVGDIAADIQKVLGDKNLDVVVATHEHKDHLSGFNGAMQGLKGKVDHVWLAWTEDPGDPDARKLEKHRGDLGESLARVAASARGTAVAKHVTALLGFAGDPDKLGAFAASINEAMEFVRTGLGTKAEYHHPGDVLEAPWLPGFRFYVLGPPRDAAVLKDLGKHGSPEIYCVAAGLRAASLAAGADAPGPGDLARQQPFDRRFQQTSKRAWRTLYPTYFEPREKGRQIEQDWLSAASDLALQLDKMTNNTSLALAIERLADRKVLLFPGDAQEGSWLSWAKVRWTVTDPGGKARQVTIDDLLARTVFYKVGHHSSHNATAKGHGLELMQLKSELIAFIPVDRTIALARNPHDSWQMPARPLYRRLLEQCQGRVARSDIGWAHDAAAAAPEQSATEKDFLGMARPDEWSAWQASQAAAKNVVINDLFIEYTLNGA